MNRFEELIGRTLTMDKDGEKKEVIVLGIETNEDGTQDIIFKYKGEE